MSMTNASGVKGYFTGTAHVTNAFPIDLKGNVLLDCMHCRFFRRSSGRCGLNNEIPAFPDHFIGDRCPLMFEEDEIVE